MECTGFDWKGYSLGELSPVETAEYDRHARTCERCRAELAQYRATVASLRSLPMQEPPRRIVFAPEPARVESSWWRRMWQPSPWLGFASASVLALAIVSHGLLARVPASADPTQMDARIHAEAQQEVSRLLPQAVDAALKTRVQSELGPAVASLQKRLSQEQQLHAASLQQKLDADQSAVRYAFDKLERRVNYSMLSSARPQGGE